MRVLGFYILTDAQLESYRQANVTANVRAISKLIAGLVVPELKRLKADHWDKDAFDRLIKFFEESHEERATKKTITF